MSADDVEGRNAADTLLRIHAAGKWPPYADDEPTRRCCVVCDLSYDGPVKCPGCGGDGYPGHTAPVTRGTARLGRPPLADPADHRVRVYLTTAEVADLDARRGDMSRSEWLATRSGLRETPATAPTGAAPT